MVRRRSTVRFRKGAPRSWSVFERVTGDHLVQKCPPIAPRHCSSGADRGGVAWDYQRKAGLVSTSVPGFGTNPSPRKLRGGERVAGRDMTEGSRRQVCTEPRLVLSVAHGAHQASCADEA